MIFSFSCGRKIVKIKKVQSFYKDNVCIVKITSEDGTYGFGQCAPFNADITQLILHKQVKLQ